MVCWSCCPLLRGRKGVQILWTSGSWMAAVGSLRDCCLYPKQKHLFVALLKEEGRCQRSSLRSSSVQRKRIKCFSSVVQTGGMTAAPLVTLFFCLGKAKKCTNKKVSYFCPMAEKMSYNNNLRYSKTVRSI